MLTVWFIVNAYFCLPGALGYARSVRSLEGPMTKVVSLCVMELSHYVDNAISFPLWVLEKLTKLE